MPELRTQLLRSAHERMSRGERELLSQVHEHYVRQFKSAKATFQQAEGIAAGMHDAVDSSLRTAALSEPDKQARVACRRGCSHCCYLNVDVTEQEARLLIYAAKKDQVPIDQEHLRAQRDAGAMFHTLSLEHRRCVFLKQGECQVYEHRPVSCRKYQVLDSSQYCDTVKYPNWHVLNFVNFESECLMSAAFNEFQSGPMPQMLLEWL